MTVRDAVRAEIDRQYEAEFGPLPADATEGDRAARAACMALARFVFAPYVRLQLCTACGARLRSSAEGMP